jgi:hypothetical protein
MKVRVKTVQKLAALAAVSAVVFLGNAAFGQTLEENMAAQLKQHVTPGKHIKAKGPNYEFCEVAPIIGTSAENAVANFYNPTGIDHCSPEQFAEIVKDKEQIMKETGAIDVFLNPSRHWTWDELTVSLVGDERKFGPVKFLWMAAVPAAAMKAAVGQRHYHPGEITRQDTYLYKKGTRVYLIDIGDGKVLVMQSWTNFVNKGETADSIKDRQPVQGAASGLEVSHEGTRSRPDHFAAGPGP